MSLWNWDPFKEYLKNTHYNFEHNPLLPDNIKNKSILRGTDHQLILSIESPQNIQLERNSAPGRIYINDSKIELTSPTGSGNLNGVMQISSTADLTDTHNSSTKTNYEVGSIEFKINTTQTCTYIVEYVANLPTHLIWPTGFSQNNASSKTRVYQGSPPLEFKTESVGEQHSRRSVRIRVGASDVILGQYEGKDTEVKSPGCILYTGAPDDDERRKIRHCLSFALGLPLVYFGHSYFCAEGMLIEFKAVTPHTVSGRAWDIPSMPPAPITTHGGRTNLMCANLFERVVQGLYEHYDRYNLSVLPWRVWYAESAAYFMRPAYFGALIEGIQNSYIEDENNGISHAIMDKSEYRRARRTLERYLSRSKIDETAKGFFLNKLRNGNSAPQKLVAERFYGSLGLKLGDLENSAWDKRNDAAHGNPILPENTIEYIRHTKVLKVMLNRIVLCITGGSDYYIDYYSENYPARLLPDPTPYE